MIRIGAGATRLLKFNLLKYPQCIINWNSPMASITIRNLDERTKARLRVRAANRKRSMEEEARNILRAVLAEETATPVNLAEAIRWRFRPFGGGKLPLPDRQPMREPLKPGK
jgi:antitoxin FitA